MSNKSVFLLLLLADKDSFRIRPLFTDPNATPIGTITGRKRWQLLCIESYQTFSPTRRMLVNMKLSEIMAHDIETVSPDATLQQTAEKMKTRNVGILPVV